MYKNPIFGYIIPQKNHQFILQYNIFQNSLKYSKYASISPTIFLQKIHPILSVAIATWGDGKITWGGGECGGIALGSRRRRRWRCRRCLHRGARRGQNA